MENFSFIQLCDPQLGFSDYDRDVESLAQAVKQINKLQVDFVVICGDMVNIPDEQSFADYHRIIGKLNVPVHCAVGNHDISIDLTPASLALFRKEIGEDRFSFTHKGFTFVITNTLLWAKPLEVETHLQDIWLGETLSNARQAGSKVFIVGHSPLFINTLEEDDFAYFNTPKDVRSRLLEMYTLNGVVAVLSGHTHWQVINEYKGIVMVSGENTSKNSDDNPLGFRLWQVESPDSIKHTFIPLDGQ